MTYFCLLLHLHLFSQSYNPYHLCITLQCFICQCFCGFNYFIFIVCFFKTLIYVCFSLCFHFHLVFIIIIIYLCCKMKPSHVMSDQGKANSFFHPFYFLYSNDKKKELMCDIGVGVGFVVSNIILFVFRVSLVRNLGGVHPVFS